MKKVCVIVLIAYILGDIHIPKYGSAKTTLESGVFYFKTNDFDEGSSIYFQLSAERGNVHNELQYEFSSSEPVSGLHLFINPITLKHYSSVTTHTTVKKKGSSYSKEYYYEIKNDRNYNYLYVKYYGFSGNYLEIESTRFGLGTFIILIIVGIIVFIVVIAIILIIIRKRRLKNYNSKIYNYNSEPQNQTQTQKTNPDFIPLSSDFYNSDYPQQQQGQSTYYQPPYTAPIN
jgi:hypothetical protein